MNLGPSLGDEPLPYIIVDWIITANTFFFFFFPLSLQINMMLANLYKKAGQERSSVTSYKEVLRQCPLALDAILGRVLFFYQILKYLILNNVITDMQCLRLSK